MKKFILAVAAMAFLSSPAVVSAQEGVPVTLPAAEIAVNQETGEFRFDIVTCESDAYAGMEFGVVCGPECEITSVTYDKEVSATGPAENEMTWFGFFDGEDSFTESMTITVTGVCQRGVDSQLALKTVKKYTIGNGEYKEEEYLVDAKMSLVAGTPETQVEEESLPLAVTEEKEVSISWITILCILGAAGIAGVLIYISFGRKKAERGVYEK